MKNLPQIIRKGIIQPRYIFAIVLILILIMLGMGLYELSASKEDIMKVLREEAISLAESISMMSYNSILSFDKIEEIIVDKLFSDAYVLERLDRMRLLSDRVMDFAAFRNKLYGIYVFDEKGELIQGSRDVSDPVFMSEYIDPVIQGIEKEVIIEPGEFTDHRYAVAVKRRRGGAIVLVDSAEMVDFRRSIGIGGLIQDIGENEGIEYIVLQDNIGLILASKNVTEMKKISGDRFLEDALKNKWIDTRIYKFNAVDVLEVVTPFQFSQESYALFRIGLSMDEVRAVESRSKQRLVIIAIIAVVLGVILLGFLLISQNYSLLSNAYDRMQTYTGMVLENTADGIIVADGEGIISVFNRSAELIFKKTAEEIIGESTEKLNPELSRIFMNSLKENNSMENKEIKIKTGSSQYKLLSISVSGFDDADRNKDKKPARSVVAVIRDITETRLMQENMRRTEQLSAMGKLTSAVAHEIRNPLNSISMFAQRLDREFTPEKDQDKYHQMINTIRSESSRLNRIVEEFLKFARPPKLKRRPVYIKELMEETLSLIRTKAQETGIKIALKENDYSGKWSIDREQMKQVLLNLFLNSIDAMPDGGNLSVNIYQGPENLCIEISDTGNGISEEDLSRVFDLYFTTKDTGTGLGLSVVQRIVMEHGGRIDVESVEGEGTTFRIYIPKEAKVNE
ncbi:PAS domain-containing protein [Candidatus Poribacteria bacterium]|nr:PAS domain-containing protein [Candidatus Poribacteria bacterium]